MAHELPPFSGDQSRCRKCGYDDAGTSYERSGIQEWLERRCLRCGYEWSEAVIEPSEVQTYEIAGVRRDFLVS